MTVRKENDKSIVIIGAGLAGLSAALTCAEKGVRAILVSHLPSERAQSVMAEGGINGALDTKGESDSPRDHFEDTMKSAAGIVKKNAVEGLTEMAPDIVKQLAISGVRFNTDENGNIDLRPFGGQKKKRTAFARDDTGKQIVTALIDNVRRYENHGAVKRYPHHRFVTLIQEGGLCRGCIIKDEYSGETLAVEAAGVIVASGGIHGLFRDTTGSLANTGEVTAEIFDLGVPVSNMEMIQYHPTTVEANGKRMLITEAARGEGGRLFAYRKVAENNINSETKEPSADEKEESFVKWYFMEEKYPELGNLMPRDVTAREIWNVMHPAKDPDAEIVKREECRAYLDLGELSEDVIKGKLAGLCEDLDVYLGLDPAKDPIPVSPGIHYFMGGIFVDEYHRTALPGLWAAGECCAQYHGANRLGGNSLLGAIYGAHVAALSACEYARDGITSGDKILGDDAASDSDAANIPDIDPKETLDISQMDTPYSPADPVRNILQDCLGVVREEKTLSEGLGKIRNIHGKQARLGEAIISSAIARKESRGGHYRSDYPERDDAHFCKVSIARKSAPDDITIEFLDPDDISMEEIWKTAYNKEQ